MSSANKTPNLNLPQWEASEKLERTDFNDAFGAIDDEFVSLIEEGVWTPVIRGEGTAGTFTSSTLQGRYIKIGGFVHVNFRAAGTLTGATGALNVRGIPFPTVNLDYGGTVTRVEVNGASVTGTVFVGWSSTHVRVKDISGLYFDTSNLNNKELLLIGQISYLA